MKGKEPQLDEIEASFTLGKVVSRGEGSGEGVDATRGQIHNDTSISRMQSYWRLCCDNPFSCAGIVSARNVTFYHFFLPFFIFARKRSRLRPDIEVFFWTRFLLDSEGILADFLWSCWHLLCVRQLHSCLERLGGNGYLRVQEEGRAWSPRQTLSMESLALPDPMKQVVACRHNGWSRARCQHRAKVTWCLSFTTLRLGARFR